MARQRSLSNPPTPTLSDNGGGGVAMSDLLEESVVVSLCQIQIVDFETVHTSIKPYTVYIILSRQERGIADEYIYSLNCMSFFTCYQMERHQL